MEQEIHISNGLPTLSSNYPWLVAQDLKPEGEQIFYSVNDPGSHYRCRIRQLSGRRIRGYFHGWMVLSNHPRNVEWSLWNPVTSKFIRLPRLILQDGTSEDKFDCCLSSAPDDPTGSILMLMRRQKPNIFFCRLDRKRKRLRWTEISYSKELTSITGHSDSSLFSPTCCNGKVYARAYFSPRPIFHLIEICITVKEEGVVIRLLPFVSFPDHGFSSKGKLRALFFTGSDRELFSIFLGVTKEKPVDVCLYKLDMNNRVWIEIKDLKDVVFFVDMDFDESVNSSPAIGSKFGGYIHFLHKTGKVIYSYHVKDKTISASSMHCLDFPPRSKTWRISIWIMPEITRLQGDKEEVEGKGDEMVERSTTNDHEVGSDEHKNEQHLLNIIPFDVMEMIMEFCVGIEYLNFRATCKLCRLAAPMIQWRNERLRLQTYSLVSPWLMNIDNDEGIMTFRDPMFGGKYLIRASTPELFNVTEVLCSRYGWLLLNIEDRRLVFYNPFTSDFHMLPPVPFDIYGGTFCFSAPPTSLDCMVVVFPSSDGSKAYIHFVAGEPNWRNFNLLFAQNINYVGFPTCCGRDVYAMFNDGGVGVLRYDLCWETIIDKAPPKAKSCSAGVEYFISKCDQHCLLVIVGEFGESVEVFELNECTKIWEKIDDLGRHMIYISDTTCMCMDAKTPEMENKIYFPRLNCDNGKIVFYSLETCWFHTFNGRNIEQGNVRGMFGTKQRVIDTQTWIEPSWS